MLNYQRVSSYKSIIYWEMIACIGTLVTLVPLYPDRPTYLGFVRYPQGAQPVRGL